MIIMTICTTNLTTPHRKQWGFLTDNIMQQSYIIFKLWIPVFLLEQWTLQSSTTFSTLAIVFCISTWKHSQSFNFTFNLLLFHCSWLWSDSFRYIQSFHFDFYTVSQIHEHTYSYRFCLHLDHAGSNKAFSFSYTNINSDELHVFEAAIDL